MRQYPFLILGVVEVEIGLFRDKRGGERVRGGVLVEIAVESAEVRGDAGVESADDGVEGLLLVAELVVVVVGVEAVVSVDQLPDIRPVVVRERLHICEDVEVLALVVLDVLHVPDPPRLLPALGAPEIFAFGVAVDLVSTGPKQRYVLLITPTDCTALGLAYLVHVAKLTLLVKVETNHAEELSLHEFMQDGRRGTVELQHGVALELGTRDQQVVPAQVQKDRDYHVAEFHVSRDYKGIFPAAANRRKPGEASRRPRNWEKRRQEGQQRRE
jgi:hypothetical protein